MNPSGKYQNLASPVVGAALGGRWAVIDSSALSPSLALLTLRDLEGVLGHRLATFSERAVSTEEVAALVEAEGPHHSPVIDAIRLEGAIVLISAAGPTHSELAEVDGASREELGSMLVDFAASLSADGASSWCLSEALLLRVGQRSGLARLQILPAPAPVERSQAEAWAAAGRLLSRLIARLLYGVSADAADWRPAGEAMPEPLVEYCAQWWEPSLPLSPPDADELRRLLGLSGGGGRVPVLTATDPLAGGVRGARWEHLRQAASARARRQIAAVAAATVLLAAIASPLLRRGGADAEQPPPPEHAADGAASSADAGDVAAEAGAAPAAAEPAADAGGGAGGGAADQGGSAAPAASD